MPILMTSVLSADHLTDWLVKIKQINHRVIKLQIWRGGKKKAKPLFHSKRTLIRLIKEVRHTTRYVNRSVRNVWSEVQWESRSMLHKLGGCQLGTCTSSNARGVFHFSSSYTQFQLWQPHHCLSIKCHTQVFQGLKSLHKIEIDYSQLLII